VSDAWIEKVYAAKSKDDLIESYRHWADQYDATMAATGYLHIPVIVGLLTRLVPRQDAAILDAGVGTGAVGSILSIIGYNNLHGVDMSADMLARAEARKCYVGLTQAVLGEALPFVDASFDAIISTGTFTTGHAPASAFDELVRILEPGAPLIFTVGTAVWEEAGFQHKLAGLVQAGKLKAAGTTPIYCPMPYSQQESGFTARAHTYFKL
jgi:SAM-dependent methyltransferase